MTNPEHPGPTPPWQIVMACLVGSGLHPRFCPHCGFWTQGRPFLRRHIRDEHPTLPQYRRRPTADWYGRKPKERE